MVVKGAPILRQADLVRTKLCFGPKHFEKMGFLGFSDETPGRRFAIFLLLTDDAQIYRKAARLIEEGVPIIKEAILVRKKLRFGPKNVEKTGFLVFSNETPEKHFGIML